MAPAPASGHHGVMASREQRAGGGISAPDRNRDRGGRPRLEGGVELPDGRRLGFAEFGAPDGRAVIWFHGTPGARRQVPVAARRLAHERGYRIVCVDRPGIGSSHPHLHRSVADFADDIEVLADRLGIEEFATIGLSGGGPYALGASARLGDRVPIVSVLGGVAPTIGDDAIPGGLVALGKLVSPVLGRTRGPIAMVAAGALRLTRPAANQLIDLYARVSPEGDRELLRTPEFRDMFLDDLINGSRKQFGAVFADILLFSRHWGFDAADVDAPVTWWHGDADNIIPFAHGEHLASRLPKAVFRALPGAGHLGGLGIADELLADIDETWGRVSAAGSAPARPRRRPAP